MNLTPLFPAAIDSVTAHFESLAEDEVVRIRAGEKEGRARVWSLMQTHAVLNGSAPTLVLPHDFPLSPARVEVDSSLCLVLPHVEADGNVCLGFLADPDDLGEPVAAVDRVLTGLTEYLAKCQMPGWVESGVPSRAPGLLGAAFRSRQAAKRLSDARTFTRCRYRQSGLSGGTGTFAPR